MPNISWSENADRLALFTASWVCRWDTFGIYDPAPRRSFDPLTLDALVDHFAGVGPAVGLYVSCPAGKTDRAIIDIDAHDEERPDNFQAALAIANRAAEVGVYPILEDSNGIGGFKITLWMAELLPIASVRSFGCWLTKDPKIEVFPKQRVQSGFGNFVRLPGRHHKRPHWSRFYDLETSEWHTSPEYLLSCVPQSTRRVPGASWSFEFAEEKTKRTEVERKRVVNIARSLVPRIGGDNQNRPSELFDEQFTWEEILEPHGWTLGHQRGDVGHWSRPGVSHVSATTDHIPGKLHVFTSEGFPLEEGKTYTKFAAHAALNHQGDWATAAKCFMNSGKARKECGERCEG